MITEVFSHHTCGHKKLCSMQVVFPFLVFLNLIRNILHLITARNAYKKCKQTRSINRMLEKTVLDQQLTTKNENKQSDANNFVIVLHFIQFPTGDLFSFT